MTDMVLQLRLEYSTVACCECGLQFAVSKPWMDEKRRDHSFWYCPTGHRQHFPGKSTEESLREQLAMKASALEREQQRVQNMERTNAALRGSNTKLQKKVARTKNGVCTDCNRSFQNLREHMKDKHPAAK